MRPKPLSRLFYHRLFYKVKGNDIESIYNPKLSDFIRAPLQSSDWVLYSHRSYVYGRCDFMWALDLFFAVFKRERDGDYIYEEFTKHIYNKDPLSQLLDHYKLLDFLRSLPPRSYFCFEVDAVTPYYPAYFPFFGNRPAIVAYCTTFVNFFRLLGSLWVLHNKAKDIWRRASRKVDEFIKTLLARYPKTREFECNGEVIEDIVRDEIEEFNELIMQYNIFRIVVLLEQIRV